MPRRFRFTEKTHSKRAAAAIVISAISLLGLVTLIGLSVFNHGSGSVYIGSAGVVLLLLSAAALCLAIRSLREENSFPTMPRAAMLLSVIACVAWAGLYAWGFTIG